MPDGNPASVKAKRRAVAYNWYTNLQGREPAADPVPQGDFPDYTPLDWVRRTQGGRAYYESHLLPEAPPEQTIQGEFPAFLGFDWHKRQAGVRSFWTNLVGREPDAGPVPQGDWPDLRFPGPILTEIFSNPLPEPQDTPPARPEYPDRNTWVRNYQTNLVQLTGREEPADPVPWGEWPDLRLPPWLQTDIYSLPLPDPIPERPILPSLPEKLIWVRADDLHFIYLIGREEKSDPVPQGDYPDIRYPWRRNLQTGWTNLFGREPDAGPVPQGDYPDRNRWRRALQVAGLSKPFPEPEPPILGSYPAYLGWYQLRRRQAALSFWTKLIGREPQAAVPILGNYPAYRSPRWGRTLRDPAPWFRGLPETSLEALAGFWPDALVFTPPNLYGLVLPTSYFEGISLPPRQPAEVNLAIEFVAFSESITKTGTEPIGTVEHDLMIADMSTLTGSVHVNADWTPIEAQVDDGVIRRSLWYHYRTDTAPNLIWSGGGAAGRVNIATYRNVLPSAPIHTSAQAVGSQVSPSISTTIPGCWFVSWYLDNAATSPAPPSMTLRSGATFFTQVADEVLTALGATGTRTWGGGAPHSVVSLAIAPHDTTYYQPPPGISRRAFP